MNEARYVNMPKGHLLIAFLRKRDLPVPDGRMLRDYECGDKDYLSLVDALTGLGVPTT